jgi:hypothetical protein
MLILDLRSLNCSDEYLLEYISLCISSTVRISKRTAQIIKHATRSFFCTFSFLLRNNSKATLSNPYGRLLILLILLNPVYPVLAGRIDGNLSDHQDHSKYKSFTAGMAQSKSTSGILLIVRDGGAGGACSAVVIDRLWIVTSAHCMRGAKAAIFYRGGKRIYSVIGAVIPKAFDFEKTYWKPGCLEYPCKNDFPAKAKSDIALLRVDEPMDGAVAKPSSSLQKRPFTGEFIGWGKKGDGITDEISSVKEQGFKNIRMTPGMSKDQIFQMLDLSLKEDALGGQNTFALIGNSFYSSDFDKVDSLGATSSAYNIDNEPGLAYEYQAGSGDSGSGLFNSVTGELVGLIAGGGYGNKIISGAKGKAYSPGAYGSLDFITPISIHYTWMQRTISANASRTYKKRPFVSTGERLRILFLASGQGKEGEPPVFLDSIFKYESEFVGDDIPPDS